MASFTTTHSSISSYCGPFLEGVLHTQTPVPFWTLFTLPEMPPLLRLRFGLKK